MRHALLIAAGLLSACAYESGTGPVTSGPVVGHVDRTSARIWARPGPGNHALLVTSSEGSRYPVTSSEHDGSVVFHVTGLEPGTRYRYLLGKEQDAGGGTFMTAPPGPRSRVKLAFGSCANDKRFPKQPVWKTIAAHRPEAMVILGDTPYIDTTDLEIQRKRYREFFAFADSKPVFRNTPTWATWDDHDFGKNDTHGRIEGKENSRRAFVEHHAHASYGEGDAGVYTSFRWGPVEVWLLDTRWFAQTEPSPADPSKKTLVGAKQWRWVTEGLKRSDATFKLLCSGMIWNKATRPLKPDHWARYRYERDALWKFIGDNAIPGVVLVGGDIHRSRALRHKTGSLAGYPLTELITSPLANTIIVAANAPHRDLLHDAAEKHTFMLMTVDGTADDPTLLAEIRNHRDQVLFSVSLEASELR